MTLLPGLTDSASSPGVAPEAGETRSRPADPTPTAAQTDKLIQDVLSRHTQSFEALDAFEDLSHGLLLAREKRQEVPCLGVGGEAWTSDDATDQEIAADLCLLCPVFALCQRYAQEAKPKAGTWAGVTSDPTKGLRGPRDRNVCLKGLHDLTQPGAINANSKGWKLCVACRDETQRRHDAKRGGSGRKRQSRAGKPRKRAAPTSRDCTCRCGGTTRGGWYLSGHDSRHLSTLLGAVRDGSLSLQGALDELAHSERLQAKFSAYLSAR